MPLALGFGISRPEHVRAIGRWADAAVVGSALVKVIAEHGQAAGLLDEVERYVRWLQELSLEALRERSTRSTR